MELSEQVKACQDVVRVVAPLLEERAEKAGIALQKFFSTFLAAAQVLPNYTDTILLISAAIRALQLRLEAADFAHAKELGDDIEPRNKRDKAQSAVYNEMTQIRTEVEAVYGAVGTQSLGMSGATPQDAPRLERFGRDVAGRLIDETFSLGNQKKSRTTFDRKSAGVELLSLCDELQGWIAVVDKETAEAKTTQEARALLLAEWQEKVPKLCALARGLLLAAGDSEGAARIISTPPRYRAAKDDTLA